MPKQLVDNWLQNKHCSQGFKSWLDQFTEKYTILDASASGAEAETPIKRKAADLITSPMKKAKVGHPFKNTERG